MGLPEFLGELTYVEDLKKQNLVHTGILLSGYINDTHTYVPGPDGKYGSGGKCFPTDVNTAQSESRESSLSMPSQSSEDAVNPSPR